MYLGDSSRRSSAALQNIPRHLLSFQLGAFCEVHRPHRQIRLAATLFVTSASCAFYIGVFACEPRCLCPSTGVCLTSKPSLPVALPGLLSRHPLAPGSFGA